MAMSAESEFAALDMSEKLSSGTKNHKQTNMSFLEF